MTTSIPDSERAVPTATGARAWRAFIECAYAVIDVLDHEMRDATGISLAWYDVLIHLEETPDGLRMADLAERILHSKSGLTRVVDRMVEEGYVRRERPEGDRRVVLVFLTDAGREQLAACRRVHRPGIQEHFLAHLAPAEQEAMLASLDSVRAHVRKLRPGRVRG